MSVVGSVSVRVVPSFSGVTKAISQQFSSAGASAGASAGTVAGRSMSRTMAASINLQSFGAAAQQVGQQVAGVGGRMTKAITLPVAGAAAAVGGLVGALGFGRLKSIDSAQGQLRGLGYSTEDVSRITENLVGALEGGMLTMGEATSAAASGMAAGVEEGEELTRYIQLLDAATAGSNGTFDEMNQIFSRIQGSGKLMTSELDMIEQRMPGFSGAAAEALGVTQQEMRAMVSAGEVSADDFLDIMDDFGGDMATEYAKTWEGMVQNTLAYVGILGEALLGGVFEESKLAIGEFIEFLASDSVAEWAATMGAAIGSAFSSAIEWVRSAIDWWINLDGSTKRLIGAVIGIAAALGPVLFVVGKVVGVVGAFASAVGGLLGRLGGSGGLGRVLARLTGPIGLVIAAFVTMWTQSEAFREGAKKLGTALWDAGQKIWEAIEPLVALVGDLLSGALSAVGDTVGWLAGELGDKLGWTIENVIIPVVEFLVEGITSLIGWFTSLGDEGTEQGSVFTGVWENIQKVVGGVVDWFMTYVVGNLVDVFSMLFKGDFVGSGSMAEDSALVAFFMNLRWKAEDVVAWFQATAIPAFKAVWDALSAAAVWVWENVLKPAFDGIKTGFDAVVAGISWAWENVLKPVWDAVSTVVSWLWESIIKPVFGFIVSAWETLSTAFMWYWNGVLKPVFNFMVDLVKFLWTNVVQPIFGFIQDRWSALAAAFMWYWDGVLKPVFEFMGDLVRWLWVTQIQPRFKWIMDLWEMLSYRLRLYYYTKIKPMIDAFGDWIKRLYNNYIKPALDWISEKWSWLSDKISDFWNDKLKPVLSAFGDFVKDDVVDRVQDGVEMIKSAWETVKSAFAAPINWVINKVWNDGIASAFDSVSKAVGSDARMAKIPEIGGSGSKTGGGSSNAYQRLATGGAVRGPGTGTSDSIRALLSNGEHVLTAAEVKAMGGHKGVYEFRAGLGKKNDVAEGQHVHPMGGGWISSAWDAVKGAASGALDWVRGALASSAQSLLKPVISAATGQMAKFGGMGELGGGLIDDGVDRLLDWIRGKDQVDASGGHEYDGPMQMGGAYRPGRGPITSWYGMRGGRLHGGVDIAGPRGAPTFAAWDGVVHSIRNYAQGSGLSVNLSHGGGKYSHYGHNDYGGIPVRAGQSVKAGQRIGNMGMTGRTTGPHVHFETWQGGLWNRRNPNHLFRDKGGLLPPGVSSVLNNTGGNEFIFNQKQFENLNRLAEQGGSGRNVTVVQHGIEFEHADRNAQAIRFAERRASRGVGVR